MKKLLLSAACVAAVMCSCTSEEENVTAVASGDKLSFSTYVDMNSRALDKSSFAVNDVLCINAFNRDQLARVKFWIIVKHEVESNGEFCFFDCHN